MAGKNNYKHTKWFWHIKMIPILLIGGGGHCGACIDVLESTGRYEIRGIVRPSKGDAATLFGYETLGADEDLPWLLEESPATLITIGQIKTSEPRRRIYGALKSLKAHFPVIVSPHARVSSHASVGEGSIVMHHALVNAGAVVSENCIVNSMALIEHDAVIGPHSHISTGARINGGVKIGSGCFVGSGAVLREGIEVGNDAIIGAGQVVMRDVPSSTCLKNHL
jgi:sugar O-acyltransferase (sialic acid O-acetyltransferase NeuD family)